MFSDPEKNLNQFSLGDDWNVADFGVGSGAYALIAAERLLSGGGHIYAVDIQKNLLSKLKKEAEEEHYKNLDVVWGDVEEPNGSGLGDNSMDAVIASNIFFQLEDKKAAIQEIRRVLRTGRRVLMIDWSESFGGLGPHTENIFKKEDARELFENADFDFVEEIKAGEHHYGLIFKKK